MPSDDLNDHLMHHPKGGLVNCIVRNHRVPRKTWAHTFRTVAVTSLPDHFSGPLASFGVLPKGVEDD